MVIYLIINKAKKFVWLDVKEVSDPIKYIKRNRLCPALIAELDSPEIEILGKPKNLETAERMYKKYKTLLNPQYNA
jgi:hypothetical protein